MIPDGWEAVPTPEADPVASSLATTIDNYQPSDISKVDDAIKTASGDTKTLLMAERRRLAGKPTSAPQASAVPDGWEPVPQGWEPVPQEEGIPHTILRHANAAAEATAATLAGVLGITAGSIGAPLHALNQKVLDAMGMPRNGEPNADLDRDIGTIANKFAQPGMAISETGQKYIDAVNEAMNQVGIPMMGLVHGIGPIRVPNLREIKLPKGVDLAKLDVPKGIPDGWEPVGVDHPSTELPPTRAQDAMNRATEGITYENVPPDGTIPRSNPKTGVEVPRGNTWTVDENGIPVRQGMPQEPTNLETQNIDVNQPHVNDLGNAIQEANGPKLGPDETYGAGNLNGPMGAPEPMSIPASQRGAIDLGPPDKIPTGEVTELDKLPRPNLGIVQKPEPIPVGEATELNQLPTPNLSIVPKGQRGGLNIKDISDALHNGMERISKAVEGVRPIAPHTPQEKVVTDVLGKDLYIPKADAPAKIASDALAEGKDGPSLWKNMQSGLMSAGDKVNSSLMKGVARWISYGDKMGERYFQQNVRPVEQALKNLSKPDMIAAQAVMRKGMFAETDYTPAQLKAAGLSDKAIAGYQAIKKAHADVLKVTNESLRRLGKEEITPMEGYMASMWNGNWHLPVLDKKGNLAWYLKLESQGEANKAIAWMKKDPKLSQTLDLDKMQAKYHPENIGMKVPRDILGAYKEMLSLFDGDIAQHIKTAMEAHIEEKGFKFQQHNVHFENKMKVRGFQGDRPWLSDHENAVAQAKAQVAYLKQAYRWAPMQEALANVKEVLSNKELVDQQPNNMEMAKAYTANAMGISRNMFKEAEQAWQKLATSDKVGRFKSVLPGNLGKFVGSLKNMTYLQQLGLSGGYAIATPLQAFLLGPARHWKLSGEGMSHNLMETAVKSLYDFSLGLVGHELKNTFSHKGDPPMTQLGKDAFRYMEDNGIISQNIFHEASGLGEYAPIHAAKQLVGWTISMPEKIARAATFMSFAHHLNASGKFKNQLEMFRRAEELTNHTLTDFRRISRPLVVDRLGQAGEMLYTYKSPLFNQYNSLGEFARDAMKGKPGPLISALGMTALLGGMTSMPFVNEADDAWNLIKWGVAKTWPTLYPSISGIGLKGTIISKMNQVAANDKVQAALGETGAHLLGHTGGYGAISALTGSQMASRFSSAIGDLSNPLGNAAPAAQEVKEWVSAAAGAANPNTTTATQGVYTALAPPAIKGNMETSMDQFKTVKQAGGQGYKNPNHIEKNETTYVRTPDEEFLRRFGMTSLQEATTKSSRYINQQESSNFKNAQEASMDKMFNAIVNKNPAAIDKYAKAYFANNGDGDGFEHDLEAKITAYAETPEQRAIIKAQSIAALKNVQRMRTLQGK